MFEDEILCDLDIKTNDGVTLRAHKARSPVLLKMLTTNMKEAKTNSVVIRDSDSKTIREMLRYIYYGEVEDLESNAKQLIYAADKYEIEKMKDKCMDEIVSKLTDQNVIEALMIADHISGAEKLFKACVRNVLLCLDDLSEDPKWKKISKDMLRKLMIEIWKTSYGCDV